MGKVQPTCNNNKEFNLYSVQVSPQKWKLSFWFIFQKTARLLRLVAAKNLWCEWQKCFIIFCWFLEAIVCVLLTWTRFFNNLFSVVRAPGFLVRYRMCIGTKLKKIDIFFNLALFQQTHFQKKKISWWMVIGNYDMRTPTYKVKPCIPIVWNCRAQRILLATIVAISIAWNPSTCWICSFFHSAQFQGTKKRTPFLFVFVPLAAHSKYFLIFFAFFHIPDIDRDFVIQFRYFIVALERTKKIAALPQNKCWLLFRCGWGPMPYSWFFREWTVIPALKPCSPSLWNKAGPKVGNMTGPEKKPALLWTHCRSSSKKTGDRVLAKNRYK